MNSEERYEEYHESTRPNPSNLKNMYLEVFVVFSILIYTDCDFQRASHVICHHLFLTFDALPVVIVLFDRITIAILKIKLGRRER